MAFPAETTGFEPTAFEHGAFQVPTAPPGSPASGPFIRVRRVRLDRTFIVTPLLPPAAVAPNGWGFEGPDFARLPWNPPRGWTVTPPGTSLELVVVPVCPVPPLFPERTARTIWNPERSASVLTPVPQHFIVPTCPVPALLPSSARLPWNPPRSAVFWGAWSESSIAPWNPAAAFPAFLGPTSWLRPIWNPERTWSVNPAVIVNTSGTPTTYAACDVFIRVRRGKFDRSWLVVPLIPPPPPTGWGFEGPDFARLAWNPPRNAVWAPPGDPSNPVVVPGAPVPPVAPERFGRFPWNPERTGTVWGPYTNIIPGAPVPPLAPERSRYPWDPPRGTYATVLGPPSVVVVVPGAPVPPGLPEGFLRFRWNPERTGSRLVIVPPPPAPPFFALPMLPQRWIRTPWVPTRSWTYTPPGIQPVYALVLPPTVRVGVPFECLIRVENPGDRMIIAEITRQFVPRTVAGAFGDVRLVGLSGTTPLRHYLAGRGWFVVEAMSTAMLAFDAIAHTPGPATLAVDLRIHRTELQAGSRLNPRFQPLPWATTLVGS